jgi:hypothetical protein
MNYIFFAHNMKINPKNFLFYILENYKLVLMEKQKHILSIIKSIILRVCIYSELNLKSNLKSNI